jgi:hypothetical protein
MLLDAFRRAPYSILESGVEPSGRIFRIASVTWEAVGVEKFMRRKGSKSDPRPRSSSWGYQQSSCSATSTLSDQ